MLTQLTLVPVAPVAFALPAPDGSFEQSLGLLAIVSVLLGILVLAFVVVCAGVASVLSVALWIMLAAVGSLQHGLLPRLGLVTADRGRADDKSLFEEVDTEIGSQHGAHPEDHFHSQVARTESMTA